MQKLSQFIIIFLCCILFYRHCLSLSSTLFEAWCKVKSSWQHLSCKLDIWHMGNKRKNVWSLMKNCISQQIRSNFDGPAKVILLKIIFWRYDIHRKMNFIFFFKQIRRIEMTLNMLVLFHWEFQEPKFHYECSTNQR